MEATVCTYLHPDGREIVSASDVYARHEFRKRIAAGRLPDVPAVTKRTWALDPQGRYVLIREESLRIAGARNRPRAKEA